MATPISRYDYFLPDKLIALNPTKVRDECRLLVVEKSKNLFNETIFKDIINIIDDNSFLVVNNTRVRNARLKASKITGGKSEVFVTEVLSNNKCKALVKGSFKVGAEILVENNIFKLISKDDDGVWLIDTCDIDIENLMADKGHIPLPPYINRNDNYNDKDDYQTVYGKHLGSSASATAGLHFTTNLLEKLKEKGIEIIEITLHVGLGTFRPVKTEFLDDHIMHYENYSISNESADKINTLKGKGKNLIAVGSTTVRALESACNEKSFITSCHNNSTNIMIKEGYNFKIIDEMITNFHLPKSTLLAMVSAFGGYDLIMKAYDYAIKNQFRFFSYGDGMYIKK